MSVLPQRSAQVPKPYPEGEFGYGRSVVDERGFIAKYPLRLGAAKRLKELQSEYAFFTLAPAYLLARMNDSPFADLSAALGCEIRIYYHLFAQPIFAGLEASDGSSDWNRCLFAVNHSWDEIRDCLVSLTWVGDGDVFRIGAQRIAVVDPLNTDFGACLDSSTYVPVTTFGVDSTRYRAAFSPRHRIWDRPTLCRYPPVAAMQQFGATLLAGGNPMENTSE
jgi:hypothetical protein